MANLRCVLLLLVGVLLAGCQVGPSPQDVAAERARWRGFQAALADDQVSPEESRYLHQLLDQWDLQLIVDENDVAPKDAKAKMEEILRVYGVAAVQVIFGPELQKRAPEAFRLVDANGDGLLSEKEILAVDFADEVVAVVVVTTVVRLVRDK